MVVVTFANGDYVVISVVIFVLEVVEECEGSRK